jgi:hypothetical protein
MVVARQFGEGVKAGIAFEDQMARISTLLDDETMPIMNDLSDGVASMARRFGVSTDILAKGLFDVISAGVDARDSLKVLEVGARTAKGGFADTAVTLDGMTTVMNSYRLGAEDAERVSDLMFTTMKEGKTTIEELSENISKLAPLADAAGLSLEQMFAAVATAVKIEKTDKTMTAIRAAMIAAAKDGRSLLDVLEEMQGQDLEGILGAGFEKRAAQGIALLAGNYEELQMQLRNAENAAGAMNQAFLKMQSTSKTSVARIREDSASIGRDIATLLTETEALPTVGRGTGALASMVRLARIGGAFDPSSELFGKLRAAVERGGGIDISRLLGVATSDIATGVVEGLDEDEAGVNTAQAPGIQQLPSTILATNASFANQIDQLRRIGGASGGFAGPTTTQQSPVDILRAWLPGIAQTIDTIARQQPPQNNGVIYR